jgi:hypothetical protein
MKDGTAEKTAEATPPTNLPTTEKADAKSAIDVEAKIKS